MSPPSLEFTYAFGRDQGARAYQEDSVEVWQRPNGRGPDRKNPVLAVLADGMGGHVAGETASQVAIDRYVQTFSTAQGSVAQLLEHSLFASNDGIASEITKNPMLNGMGCTLVAAYLDEDGLRWVSVGDSSLLLYRGSVLVRLNEDHSLGALLDKQAQAKQISFEDARSDPRRRSLRSALVGADIAVKDLCLEPFPLYHGDWIIVASDGLETLKGDDIATIIGRQKELGDPSTIARNLLDAVKEKAVPNQDNVSVVVIKIVDLNDASTQVLPGRPRKEEPVAEPAAATPLERPAIEPEGHAKEAGKPMVRGAIVSIILALAIGVYYFASKIGLDEHAASPPPGSTVTPAGSNPLAKANETVSAAAPSEPASAPATNERQGEQLHKDEDAPRDPPPAVRAKEARPKQKDGMAGASVNPAAAAASGLPKPAKRHTEHSTFSSWLVKKGPASGSSPSGERQ